jgi:hypothetical protein
VIDEAHKNKLQTAHIFALEDAKAPLRANLMPAHPRARQGRRRGIHG